MNRQLIGVLVTLGSLLPCGSAATAKRQDSPLAQLAWLAGCWESTRGERRIEEQWMWPRGETMLGMSRTVTGNKTGEFEFMQVREHEGRLVFTAWPSGQGAASFGSIEISQSKVVFENAAHDFPQRIIYQLNGDGSLTARIEGEQGGQRRGVDFPMRRTHCFEGTDRR